MKNQLWLAATLLLTLAACGTTPNTGNSKNPGNHGSGGSGGSGSGGSGSGGAITPIQPSSDPLAFIGQGETNHATNAQLYLQGATKKIAVGTIVDGKVNISISPEQVAELGTMSLVDAFNDWETAKKLLPSSTVCDPIQKTGTNEDAKVFLFEGTTIGDTNDKLVATLKNSTPPLYHQFIYADSDAKLNLSTNCIDQETKSSLKLDIKLDLKKGWNRIATHPILIKGSNGSLLMTLKRNTLTEKVSTNTFKEYWTTLPNGLLFTPPVVTNPITTTTGLTEAQRTFRGTGIANVVKNEPLVIKSRGTYVQVGNLTKDEAKQISAVDFTITPEQLDQLAIKGSEIANYPVLSYYPLAKCAIPEQFKKLNQFLALTDIQVMIPGEQHPTPLFPNQHLNNKQQLINDMFFFVDQPVEVKETQECFAEAIKTKMNYNLDLKPGWNRLRVTYKINTSTLRPETDISSVGLANSFDGNWSIGR